MISSDPLTSIANGNSETMPPYSDPNENILPSKYQSDKLPQQEKKYDFLVWNDECNQAEADRIYTELEKQGLRGYIYERDKRAGQYKLPAMSEAIQSTANIILLLSPEALKHQDFQDKMHRTITCEKNASVIPIYIGMRKAEGPRLLRHHVDIQYKDDQSLWTRLYGSIQKPKRTSESPEDKVGLSKRSGKRVPSHSSPVSSRMTPVPRLVPGSDGNARSRTSQRTSLSPPKSSKETKSKGLLSLFGGKSKKKEDESNECGIPLNVIRSRRSNGSPSLERT